MRSENSIRNIKYNVSFFLISFIFIFVQKKIFIVTLGPEITGLNDLFKNIIGFLNISELGIINAVTFSLYNPLRNRDFLKINSIIAIYRYMYRIVSCLILFGSLVVCFFIFMIIRDNPININFIRITFLIFAMSTVISYIFTYIQVIAIADEKIYIVTKITGIFNIVKNMVQMAVLIITKNYIYFLVFEVVFNALSYFIINRTIINNYNWLDLKKKWDMKVLFRENVNLFKNTKNLFVHKISGFVLLQTDSILISAFINLKSVAIYSSYMMIVNGVTQLFYQVYRGITASVGSLIAEKKHEKSFNLWKNIYIFAFFISAIICFSFFKLANDFVTLWIGKEFLITEITLILISLNLFFSITRQSVDSFKDGYGIFWDTGAPVFEAATNIVISVVLVQRYGIIGVVIGTNISNFLIIFLWKPYIVFREGFKKSFFSYLYLVVKLIVFVVISLGISNLVIDLIGFQVSGLVDFIIKSILVVSITTVITSLPFFVSRDTKNVLIVFFKTLMKRILKG